MPIRLLEVIHGGGELKIISVAVMSFVHLKNQNDPVIQGLPNSVAQLALCVTRFYQSRLTFLQRGNKITTDSTYYAKKRCDMKRFRIVLSAIKVYAIFHRSWDREK